MTLVFLKNLHSSQMSLISLGLFTLWRRENAASRLLGSRCPTLSRTWLLSTNATRSRRLLLHTHSFETMSVFTALSLVFLAYFSPIVLGSALPVPCPECEAMGMEPSPVIVTKTEPCEECETKPTEVIVTKTEPCEECEHDHPTPTPTMPFVFTSTISTCRRQTSHSIYTSGSHTWVIPTCKPTTYTERPSACKNVPPSTVYESVTLAGLTTTLYGNGSTVYMTSIKSGFVTESITFTSYATGSPPATVGWRYEMSLLNRLS